MSNITEQLTELVRKNLPESTANEMKEFIVQAQDDKKELNAALLVIERLEKRISETDKELDEVRDQLKQHEELDSRKVKLDDLAKELAEEQAKIDTTVIQTKLEMMMDRENAMFSLVEKVFGHPGVKVSTCGQTPVTDAGGYVSSFPHNQETVTKEEKS